MKINCSQESLFYGLQTVQKAITNKSQIPIYDGILFEAKEDNVHLYATNLEIGIDCYIPAKVDEEGSVVMPSKIISGLIQKLPQEDILIEGSEQKSIVKTKNSQYEIMGFLADEFSSFPKIEPIVSVKISQGDLKNAIKKVIPAVSRNEQRSFLNGASFKLIKNKLEISATDSHRLSHHKCKITRIGQSNEDEYEVIVPQKTLVEMLKLLDDSEEVFVKINIEEKQAMFVLYPGENKKSIQVYTRLIQGTFPDFKQIIPKSFNTNIKVNNENFKKGIERVSLFTEYDSGHFSILTKPIEGEIKVEDEYEMYLSSKAQNLGKAKEELICYSKGDDIDIVISSSYVLDILNSIEEDDIILRIVDNKSPIVIIPKDNKNSLYVVMPILKEE